MIDNAALAVYPFRTSPFPLGDTLSTFHWRAHEHGGLSLLRDDSFFFGEVRPDGEGMWVIERDAQKLNAKTYFSRDAAAYALVAEVSERNAQLAATRETWDARMGQGVEGDVTSKPDFDRAGYVVVREDEPRLILDHPATRREALALAYGRADKAKGFEVLSAEDWFQSYHDQGAIGSVMNPRGGLMSLAQIVRQHGEG